MKKHGFRDAATVKERFVVKKILYAAVLLVLLPLGLHATTSDTYVSYRGADSNSCSRVLPCRTVTQALTVTTTDGTGTVHIIDTGNYAGFTVNGNASVIADPGIAAAILPSPSGDSIDINGGDVLLKNLQMYGANTAISITSGHVIVEDLTFFNNGVDILENTGATLLVRRCHFNGSTNYELNFHEAIAQNGGEATIKDSEFNHYYIGIQTSNNTLISHCIFTHNIHGTAGSFTSTGDNVFFRNITDTNETPSPATVF
jgi:hypothetical protein